MRLGTKTVLFGFHQFLLHPIFVAVAWWKLYGFPSDLRLWLAFCVHDLGYLGKKSLDDADGETHPELGAKLMRVFGEEWSELVLLHSRFYAKRLGKPVSRLCMADKLGICLYPKWLWLGLTKLSGEWSDYATAEKYNWGGRNPTATDVYEETVSYLRTWVKENA